MSRRRLKVNDAMLGCIRYRHAMRPTGEMHRRRTKSLPYGNEVELWCPHCGSFRYDTYNRLGKVHVQTYDLSPAYRKALDLMRSMELDRNTDVTLEVLHRLRTSPAPRRGRLRMAS